MMRCFVLESIRSFLESKPLVEAKVNPMENPKFKSWFGDSKVVDKHGKPLVAYHGTTSGFKRFGTSSVLSAIGWHYFNVNPAFAEKFAYSEKPIEDAKRSIKVHIAGPSGEIEVDGFETDIPGLAIANIGDRFSLTAKSCGLSIARSKDIEDIDNIVKRLKAIKIDWTKSKDELTKLPPATLRRVAKAVHDGMGDSLASMFSYKGMVSDFGVGSQVMPVYLSIEKPLDLRSIPAKNVGYAKFTKSLKELGIEIPERLITFGGRDLYQILNMEPIVREIRRQAMSLGYDGVVFKDYYDQSTRGESWIAFFPDQIKSATGNKGEYSKASDDVTESMSS